ncbi:MAG: MraY family glycosyltransferase [Candidatus Magasanikbacteria bacterium]
MLYFISAFVLSILLTLLVRFFAFKYKIIDAPNEARKRHGRSVPLLGGLAIFLAFWTVMAYLVYFTNLIGKNLAVEKLWWVFVGGLVLIIIGALDDKYKLSYKWRLPISALVVLLVIIGGVGIDKVTNPFGGVWYLDFVRIGPIAIIADTIVFLWILGMMYTTKILDGLDGLTSGISGIAALMIFFIANGERWHQSDVALVGLVLAGAILGFLLFNFYPAKIFLGEGGSLWLGFMLGVLSVISGGKFATALLVMAVPILDLAWVIFTRARHGTPISKGDRQHLHFRLVDSGFSQRWAVLFYYLVAILFGVTTLFLQSIGKVTVLLVLVALVFIVEMLVNKKLA